MPGPVIIPGLFATMRRTRGLSALATPPQIVSTFALTLLALGFLGQFLPPDLPERLELGMRQRDEGRAVCGSARDG